MYFESRRTDDLTGKSTGGPPQFVWLEATPISNIFYFLFV
jgi:hypothetical protein